MRLEPMVSSTVHLITALQHQDCPNIEDGGNDALQHDAGKENGDGKRKGTPCLGCEDLSCTRARSKTIFKIDPGARGVIFPKYEPIGITPKSIQARFHFSESPILRF